MPLSLEEFNAGFSGSLRMIVRERTTEGSYYSRLTTRLQYHCDIQRGCVGRLVTDQARLVSESLSA